MQAAESVLPDGSFQIVWKEGYFQFKRIASGVVFCRKVGDFHEDVFKSLIAPFNSEFAKAKKLAVVCDGSEMQAYTGAYRQLWTEWFKAHSGHVKVYIFTRSKLVRMAVTVVNMFVDVFELCNTEAKLHAVLSQLAASFQPAMLPPRIPQNER